MGNSFDFPEGCVICDTDIWVRVCLAGIIDEFINYHPKLFFSDVVEGEILKWEHGGDFTKIATEFKKYRDLEHFHVIHHSEHIPEEDRTLLEHQLFELGFSENFKNRPPEDNKGEFVSAIYADYFNIPILKTNDGAFSESGNGRRAFPDLVIHNWYDIVEQLFCEPKDKIRIRKIAETEARKMEAANDKYKRKKAEDEQVDLYVKLEQLRSKYNK